MIRLRQNGPIVILLCLAISLQGQSGDDVPGIDAYKPGKSLFMLRGYAHSGLQVTDDATTFEGGSFNPLFIYKQSDRLLFESELEMELDGDHLEISLEYANISYLLSNSMVLRLGKILSPFGIFTPNLHPAWINKFPGAPLGVGHHGGILPTSDIGVELRGAGYLGPIKTNYSVYVVNGPSLNSGDEEPEEAGMLHFGDFPDNNKDKFIGGRIGVFPSDNSSLEIGFSAMTGKVGENDSPYEDLRATLFGVDATFVKAFTSLKSILDIKAQYAYMDVENTTFPLPDDPTGELFYDFENNSTTYFIQTSVRPALVENSFFRKLEFVGRYSSLETPEDSLWGVDQSQWETGINFWLDWRTVLKFSYKWVDGVEETADDDHGHGATSPVNAFLVHWAIGL